jgi:enoyl-[acyl-carrier protein] reductase I
MVSMVRTFAPLMKPGGSFLSLTYMAGERVIPGYGGGMSSAKAALQADTRTLAYEAGRRHGVRINAISAGPWASRAASAIGFIDMMIDYCKTNSPLPRELDAKEVGATAAFLASPLAGGNHRNCGLRRQRLSRDGDGRGAGGEIEGVPLRNR